MMKRAPSGAVTAARTKRARLSASPLISTRWASKAPELKDTVTLRDRDTMKQQRVKISDLLPILSEKIR